MVIGKKIDGCDERRRTAAPTKDMAGKKIRRGLRERYGGKKDMAASPLCLPPKLLADDDRRCAHRPPFTMYHHNHKKG